MYGLYDWRWDTPALETATAGARLRARQAGANVLMPNLTLREFASSYEIYPGKQAPHLTRRQEIRRTPQVVAAAGRFLGLGPGHSPRIPQNA